MRAGRKSFRPCFYPGDIMRIGNIKLDVPLVLAPMAGISDLPYRVICRQFGCGLTVSEMVSAKGLLYNNEKTFAMLQIDPAERPTAIQLFGSVPEELAEAAKIVEDHGADIIDFNMGCPVPKVVNNGEGSALMKTPELAGKILAAMVKAVKIPVTVKFRAGWDEEHRNAHDGVQAAVTVGLRVLDVVLNSHDFEVILTAQQAHQAFHVIDVRADDAHTRHVHQMFFEVLDCGCLTVANEFIVNARRRLDT